MKTRAPLAWPLLSLLGTLVFVPPALAQNQNQDDSYPYPDEEKDKDDSSGGKRDADSPYAYPDDAPSESTRPRRRPERPVDTPRTEEPTQEKDFQRLARSDDPNTGIAFELLGGAMLLSSARGQLFGDPVPSFGGRFTWEYGRLLNSEPLREALWLDLRYAYAGERSGTSLIAAQVQRHYATLAPAYERTFGENSDYGLFLQVGGGIAYELSALEVGGKLTPIGGLQPLIQYGVGLRGRSQLSIESNLRLSWRVELMRFHRGYQDDTYVGLSAGLAF